MKKIFSNAWLMVTAIAGLGFTSCSSTDEAEVNPTYDPVAGTVNADFVFNVSTGNSTQSRQSAANTQATTAQVFRGITNAQLFAYQLASNGKNLGNPADATAATATKAFAMGSILAPNTLDPDGDGSSAPKSRRVIELALPTGTNTLLFWGKAPKTENAHAAQGKITFNASSKNILNHEFSLQPILSGDNYTAYAQYRDLLKTALDRLSNVHFQADANSLVWPATSADGGDGVTKNADAIDVYWSDFAAGTQASGSESTLALCATCPMDGVSEVSALGETLGNAFVAMHKIYSNEVRCGSGEAVRFMLKDLYDVVNGAATAIPTSYSEYIVKRLAIKVKDEIDHMIDATGEYKDITSIKSNLGLSTGYDQVTASLDGFPATLFGVPVGGAQLTCEVKKVGAATHNTVTWSYSTSVVGPGTGYTSGSTATFAASHCMYPAELCYFGNSPVHVSDTPRATNEFPDGPGTLSGEWLNSSSWTGWDKNSNVKSTSRAVAMAHNINYGTALLATTVSYATSSNGILVDNNHAIQARHGADEENKQIDVSQAGLFQLTGILVGGQEQTMGWNYIAKSPNNWDYVIYDNQIVAPNIPAYGSGATAPTYTMVWDNYNASLGADAQQKVYVALELKNCTGKSFWAKENMVRPGGTFYLIGLLDPAASGGNATNLSTIAFPTSATPYALPPYDADGNTIQAKRVFIQDYMTTANFVMGANSLQKAYLTVPDLRSTQISLGLSVDLNWSAGLNFDNVLLGD